MPVRKTTPEPTGVWQMSGFGVSLSVKVTNCCCSEKKTAVSPKYEQNMSLAWMDVFVFHVKRKVSVDLLLFNCNLCHEPNLRN